MINPTYRPAAASDIQQIQIVRHSVKENRLSNPDLVPDKDVLYYLTEKGKGWVCEIEGKVVGFSIIDLKDRSVWALFVDPDFSERGIGKHLHRLMLDWYFDQTRAKIVLGTAPNTRAARFYELQGWDAAGNYPNGEVKFELTYLTWSNQAKIPYPLRP